MFSSFPEHKQAGFLADTMIKVFPIVEEREEVWRKLSVLSKRFNREAQTAVRRLWEPRIRSYSDIFCDICAIPLHSELRARIQEAAEKELAIVNPFSSESIEQATSRLNRERSLILSELGETKLRELIHRDFPIEYRVMLYAALEHSTF